MKYALKDANRTLIEALSTDEVYKKSWVDNISSCFRRETEKRIQHNEAIDHNNIAQISQKAAERFINQLIKAAKIDANNC